MKETITCARKGCDNRFVKVTHNQKYCSNDCCREETNKKIMEKYHERAAIKRGKKRKCLTCSAVLSRYNLDGTCAACTAKNKAEDNVNIDNILTFIAL